MRVSKYLDHLNGLLFKRGLRGWLEESLIWSQQIDLCVKDEASNHSSWARLCYSNQQFPSNIGLRQHKYISCSWYMSIMDWKGPILVEQSPYHTLPSHHTYPRETQRVLNQQLSILAWRWHTQPFYSVCWPVTWPHPTSEGLGHVIPAYSWKVRTGNLMGNTHDYHKVIDMVEIYSYLIGSGTWGILYWVAK